MNAIGDIIKNAQQGTPSGLSLTREPSSGISLLVVPPKGGGGSSEAEPSRTIPARKTERMMKRQDAIAKAMAGKPTWIQAVEIAWMSVRNMQRMRQAA